MLALAAVRLQARVRLGPVEGKAQGMHRVTLEVIGGIDIPEGHHAGHTCHDRDENCPGGPCPHRACVNWLRHLEPMAPLANYRAGRALRKPRCPAGHLLSGDNLWISRTRRDGPVRRCRECTTRQNGESRARVG